MKYTKRKAVTDGKLVAGIIKANKTEGLHIDALDEIWAIVNKKNDKIYSK